MTGGATDPHAKHASSQSNQDEEILSVEVVPDLSKGLSKGFIALSSHV